MPDMQAQPHGLPGIKCRDFLESHAEYLDGVLPAAETRRFDAHVASCRSCARYDRVLRRGLLLARNLPEIEPSPHFHENLQLRLMGVQHEGPQAIKANNATVVVIAAVLALVAVTPLLKLVPEPEQAAAPAPVPVLMAPFGTADFAPVSATMLVRSAGNSNFTPVVVQPPALQSAPSAPRMIAYPSHQTEDR